MSFDNKVPLLLANWKLTDATPFLIDSSISNQRWPSGTQTAVWLGNSWIDNTNNTKL